MFGAQPARIFEETVCKITGKQRHASPQGAWRQLISLKTRRLKAPGKEKMKLQVYKCRARNGWHVGHHI